MDAIQKNLLRQIADLHGLPEGAYNLRANGKTSSRRATAHIDIASKPDGRGIDVVIRPGTCGESLHVPVVLSESGLEDTVHNDFYIGEDCDIAIIAGCGISNCGTRLTEHSGMHSFHIGRNSRVRYVERHYGEGGGENVMNPVTEIELGEGSFLELETTQIKGVDSAVRATKARLSAGSVLLIREKVMTHGHQLAKSEFTVELDGDGCSADVVSRSVACGQSKQIFISHIHGNSRCRGHSECDAIIMDGGVVTGIPEVTANCVEAQLIHEAAIGKIAGEQLTKLMTLGLTEKEAEEQIIAGFLR